MSAGARDHFTAKVGSGLPLTALGLVIAALTALMAAQGAAWWVWTVSFTWFALSFMAALGQADAPSRRFITGTLKHSRFMQVYDARVPRWHGPIWERFCDPVPKDAGFRETFWGALTWRLYDRALLIAVVYPIILLVGWWIVTGEARLGGEPILGFAPFWWERAATLFALALMISARPAEKMAAASRKVFLQKVSGWLPIVLFLVAFAGVFAVAVAGEGAFAGEGVFAVAVAVAFAGAGAFAGVFAVAFAGEGVFAVAVAVAVAVAGAVAVAVAFAVAVAVEDLDSRGFRRTARLIVTTAIPSMAAVLLVLLDWQDVPSEVRTIFLFLGVLPLINALFDVISYAATLTCMRLGLSRQPLLYGALDLAVALVLFLALGATLTLVIAGMNRLAGIDFIDFGALFAGLRESPHDYWWLYAMVFSTILPTLIHALIALLGAQGLVPQILRRPVANLMQSAPTADWRAALAPLAVGAIWTLPLAAIGAVFVAGWHLLGDALARIGSFYLTTLLDLAIWIGAL
ncbi:MAG: hypothetical protein AAF718_14565 [Pseudomonadota bacterium]